MTDLSFPVRDEEVREVCSQMLGLSKSCSKKFTKEELILVCQKRGYITTVEVEE